MDMHINNLPPALLVALVVYEVIDLALLVIALVRLARTPAERRSLPWPAWLAIIVLVRPIGAIVFLIIGRNPAKISDPAQIQPNGAGAPVVPGAGAEQPAARTRTAADTIDELYNKDGR